MTGSYLRIPSGNISRFSAFGGTVNDFVKRRHIFRELFVFFFKEDGRLLIL